MCLTFQWGVTPLVDNHPSQKVYYKISVFTGIRQSSGTRSRISFILSGDHGDTGVRVLDDGRGKVNNQIYHNKIMQNWSIMILYEVCVDLLQTFSRGSLRHFVLSTESNLGNLTFLRVWHDNSGPGVHGGWFLDKIVAENVHTGDKYAQLKIIIMLVHHINMLTLIINSIIDMFLHTDFSSCAASG